MSTTTETHHVPPWVRHLATSLHTHSLLMSNQCNLQFLTNDVAQTGDSSPVRLTTPAAILETNVPYSKSCVVSSAYAPGSPGRILHAET